MTTVENVLYSPIPLDAGRVEGWKNIPIKNDHLDPLVPLGMLSQEAAILMTSSVYFGEHDNSPYAEAAHKLEGSLLTLFARRSVVRRLLAAEQLLPAGYHLIVFDAYRTYQVQKSLYDFYKKQLKRKRPDMRDEILELETQNYVSLPSHDPTRPSPHNTGGAVDVAIVKVDPRREEELLQVRSQLADSNLDITRRIGLELQLSAIMRHCSRMLDFGTPFDHGGEKASLNYYESKIAAGEILTDSDLLACNNRRLLFTVMTKAGFQPYFAEWWHFNAPESQMGAATAGHGIATFGAVVLDENNKAHEATRLRIRQAVSDDPKIGGDWPTEIIAPPEDSLVVSAG